MIIRVLSSLILSLIAVNLYAETAPDSDATAKLVQTSMTALMQKNGIPGAAVELYVDGRLYEQYYGYAKPEPKDPVTRKTIFEIGSLSKIMTSVLLAQEVDWAKMALNDPLTKYVKGLPQSFDKIKLQDLATHTAGLPFNLPRNINNQIELQEYLNDWSPKGLPGEEWRYSNVGIGLLGQALERSTDSDYGDLYRRHILNPLKMVYGVSVPKTLMKYYADGYDAKGQLVTREVPGLFPAASDVKASALDMQRFLSAAIGLKGTPPRVLYPMKLTQSMFIKMNDYDYQGLAWQIHSIKDTADIRWLLSLSDRADMMGPLDVQTVYQRPIYSGSVLMDKTGATKGFRTYIAVIPNKQSGIVILVNKNISDRAIVRTAREILFKVTDLV